MSMYLDADLINDETTVAETTLALVGDHLNSALGLAPDEQWEPQEGSPETSFAESVGIVLATAMSMVQDQERNDFAEFGQLILNTPRVVAEPATVAGRWNFATNAEHTVPDGSEVVIDNSLGEPIGFATVGDVTFTGVQVDIPMIAVEPGAETTGIGGAVREWAPVPQVTGVTFVGLSAGGTDEETREAYLEKIVRRARRMKLVPVITDDYADTALDHTDVARAVAVRLLNADAPTDPPATPGHVTIYVASTAGADLSEVIRNQVRDSMSGEDRPLAVTVHVRNPTRTNITIAVSIRLTTAADATATTTAVQAAINDRFGAARYGLDEDAAGRWRAPRTTAERTINEYDVTAAIDDIVGIAKIEAVTINGGSSVTLTGWAPLPNLAAIAAALTTALAGVNNDLTFTADTAGAGGNAIRVRYVVAGASTALSVAVVGNDVTVNVATDAGSVATSTAAQVRDAVNAHVGAAALVTAANAAGNDGTGVVAALAYTNLTGGTDAIAVTVL